jgi:hypothetical protein
LLDTVYSKTDTILSEVRLYGAKWETAQQQCLVWDFESQLYVA